MKYCPQQALIMCGFPALLFGHATMICSLVGVDRQSWSEKKKTQITN